MKFTERELKKFGSDVNKYIHVKLDRTFSCVNYDAVLEKKSQNRKRILEYKHVSEELRKEQLMILRKETRLARYINELPDEIKAENFLPWWKNEVFVIWCDFDDENELIGKAKIFEFLTGKTYYLSCDQLDAWLSFEVELDQI
jgi:hypothetical protein